MSKQIPLTAELLAFAEKPYEQYNTVLEAIMTRLPLDVQVQTFQRVLGEELPLTTARRAYRTAIRIAMGEEDVPREYSPKPAKGGRKAGVGGKRSKHSDEKPAPGGPNEKAQKA